MSYSALHVLSRRCYGRQRCRILVNSQHFGSPCLPGVKKYLTVTYACGKTMPSTRAACSEVVAVATGTAASKQPGEPTPETAVTPGVQEPFSALPSSMTFTSDKQPNFPWSRLV